MGGAARYFLIDSRGDVAQLPTATFQRMVASPDAARLAEFADTRVACVEVRLRTRRDHGLELDRAATFYLRFNQAGELDLADLGRQLPTLLAASYRGSRPGIDAPSITKRQAAMAIDAALGRHRVPRLRAAAGGASRSRRRATQGAPTRVSSAS